MRKGENPTPIAKACFVRLVEIGMGWHGVKHDAQVRALERVLDRVVGKVTVPVDVTLADADESETTLDECQRNAATAVINAVSEDQGAGGQSATRARKR